MPYVDSWDEFAEEAQRILSAAPSKARLLTTFRHKEKALVVKATDDIECVKFKTNKYADLKGLDKLNTWALTLLTDKRHVDEHKLAEAKKPPVRGSNRKSGAQKRAQKKSKAGTAKA